MAAIVAPSMLAAWMAVGVWVFTLVGQLFESIDVFTDLKMCDV